jgi:hypothetical protein
VRVSCATVLVVSPQEVPGRSGFSVTRILDLELRAHLRPQPAGPHLLELKLYTPHGHLYQVLPVAFEGSASTPAPVATQARWQAVRARAAAGASSGRRRQWWRHPGGRHVDHGASLGAGGSRSTSTGLRRAAAPRPSSA